MGRGLDLIFPHHRLDDGARSQTAGLSPEGWARIAFIEAPLCDGCGSPFEYDIGARCTACQVQPRAFDRARAACFYDDGSRDLVLQFKHADRTDLAPLLAAWVQRAAQDLLSEAQVIVPVPLHPHRLFRRRYNQAAEIARPLARRFGLDYRPGALIRRRATASQAGKSGTGRRRNVTGVFAVPSRSVSAIRGRRVLLIDDVFTTGATTEACARTLLKAGAAAVDVAVVAKARPR